MFDVIWTDPDRELVGERRARKEVEKEMRERDQSRAARNSQSTRSSSSSGEKPFSFLGSKNLRKVKTPLKGASSASSGLLTPTVDTKRRRGSFFGATPASQAPESNQDLDSSQMPSESTFLADQFMDQPDQSPSSSSRGLIDSIFSRWTDTSAVSPPSTCSIPESTTKSSIVQTLGPSSFITKSTEVTVVPRTPDTADISHLISEITISADGCKHEPPTPPRSPGAVLSTTPPTIDTAVNPLPGVKTPLRPTSPSWSFKPNNPDAWKPPEAWDCSPVPEFRSPTIGDVIMEETEPNGDATVMSMDLHGMQREIRRMIAATPDTILLRLKESWGPSHDAVLYKELEMEKKRWMLSALHNLDPPGLDDSTSGPYKTVAAKAHKILALYESQATASYLAGLHYNKQVYHLSSSPLSHLLFPNIHPIFAPATSHSGFPVATQLFGAVYSLSLPSVMSSQEIPQVLKQVHRCLAPGGIFHLTLIDPMPLASTLGPHMRTWLEENLIFNLDRSFRCTSPSKLFPVWLTDAGLRGGGSAITTVKFLAAPDMNQDIEIPEGCTRAEREKKIELRSVVGRMLWTEVWGTFVGADSWWWDDPVCMEECTEMRTCWEYSLIEAVKES